VDGSTRNGLLGFSASIDGPYAFAGAPAQTSKPGLGYLFNVESGQATHTLIPSVSRQDDLFGFNAKVTGTKVLVGDPGNPFGQTNVVGAAYVFDIQTGTELMRLMPNDSFEGDEFGFGINAHEQLAIIGAPNLGTGTGAAYLFDLETGSQLRKFVAADAFAGAEFGADVALSAQFAVVGAPGNYNALGFVAGFAYVFDTATGTQLHKLQASDSSDGNEFGFDVAVDGHLAVVGAPDGGVGEGAAYLFDLNTGQQIAKLQPDDPTAGNDFGSSVDIDGNHVLVGASGLNQALGAAYLFDAHTGLQKARLRPGDIEMGDAFGVSVSISGSSLFIGSPQDDDISSNAGAAYLYQWFGDGDFNLNGVLDADDIDLLTLEVIAGNHSPEFDLNEDDLVDAVDRQVWVNELALTFWGDSNLDGQFDSDDLIGVLQFAEYEDDVAGNSTWAEGDWNGDLDFDTQDLILGLQTGAYEMGTRGVAVMVPEPRSLLLCVIGLGLLWRRL